MPLDRYLSAEIVPVATLGLLALVVLWLLILTVAVVAKPGRRRFDELAMLLHSGRENVEALAREQRQQAADMRSEGERSARALREEVGTSIHLLGESLQSRVGDLGRSTAGSVDRLNDVTARQLETLRKAVDDQLDRLRDENGRKLDEMRRTVDEKLQQTLEQRLGESFRLVGEQLNSVYRGLGEMQQVAGEVGDLKRILGNVKTRGGWAEVQLEAMLEQFLHPDQYIKNAAVRSGSADRVEFAIRLPGRDEHDRFVLLPLDAKFPKEDYERLCDALERVDHDQAAAAGKALEERFRLEARRIQDKYIDPPTTTDFAVMFLPTEGLYAEVARRPGLLADLQNRQRVMVAGPSTLGALLNSLQMGFRTLALSRRSTEVWEVLRAAKTEFGRFAETIDKVRRSIDTAGKSLDAVGVRTRVITRALRQVETLPDGEASDRLGVEGADPADVPATGDASDREPPAKNENGGAFAPPS